MLGDFDLAEEAVQDAFVIALESGRTRDPANPSGWITTTARNRAIDRIRHSGSSTSSASSRRSCGGPEEDQIEDSSIPDDRLRLIFTCRHPALGRGPAWR